MCCAWVGSCRATFFTLVHYPAPWMCPGLGGRATEAGSSGPRRVSPQRSNHSNGGYACPHQVRGGGEEEGEGDFLPPKPHVLSSPATMCPAQHLIYASQVSLGSVCFGSRAGVWGGEGRQGINYPGKAKQKFAHWLLAPSGDLDPLVGNQCSLLRASMHGASQNWVEQPKKG